MTNPESLINDNTYETLLDRARELHNKYRTSRGIRGQTLTKEDGFDYWVMKATAEWMNTRAEQSSKAPVGVDALKNELAQMREKLERIHDICHEGLTSMTEQELAEFVLYNQFKREDNQALASYNAQMEGK